MKPTEKPQHSLTIGRRSFLGGAAALGAGAGLAAPAIISRAAATETSSIIALRDHDLPFIATEETYTTDELIALNAINDDHVEYLRETGLAELGPGRIGAMDQAGINVQILSAHTPGVQDLAGGRHRFCLSPQQDDCHGPDGHLSGAVPGLCNPAAAGPGGISRRTGTRR